MDVENLVQAMTPDIYERLRSAVETGKWPDGTPLNEQQKEHTMQAVMLYQAKVLQSDQHMTVGGDGEVVHKSKRELKKDFAIEEHDEQTIARFSQDDF